MNFSNSIVAGALLVIGLLGGYRQAAADAEIKGYIRLAENPDGGGKACSIPITHNELYNLDKTAYGCNGDDYSYFMLDNVRSAAVIELSPDVDCPFDWSSANNWGYRLRTYKHPTTTVWTSILSLKGYQDGDIVKAGMRLEHGFYRKGDIEAELECVNVRVSPLP